MNSSASFSLGHSDPMSPALRRLARLATGERMQHPQRLQAILLPLVSRALRTGRGPAGLLQWIDRTANSWPVDQELEQEERSLTDVLVNRILEPQCHGTDA